MRNTLERHKAFPYFAWTLVIGLAGAVWMLATALQNEADALAADRTHTERAVERDLRHGTIEY